MKNLIMTLACIVGLSTIINAQTTQQYQEIPINSNHAQFKNPEEGENIFSPYIVPINWNCQPTARTCDVQRKKLVDFPPGDVNINTTVRRIYNLYDFNYNGSVIDGGYLADIQSDFNYLRNNGLKATISFEYIGGNERYQGNPGQFTENFPLGLQPHPNVQTVLNHIDQIGPILQQNSDVISVFKAGFIGQYGEWYGLPDRSTGDDFGVPNDNNSPTLGLTPAQWQNRQSVLDKLLDYLPQNRMIEIRNPHYKINMYGLDINNNQVNLSTAYDGSNLSRIGWHNDGWGIQGYYTFYQNVQQLENFASNESKYVSGFIEAAEAIPGFFECGFAINDMERFHISHISNLQPKLEEDVEDTWTNEGCFNEIYNRLGYRFVMTNASVSNGQVKPGGFIDLTINLNNVGFAAPVNPRNVQLVFRHNGNGSTYKVNLCNQDPRFWFPNEANTISERVGIPNNMPNGTYSLLLNLNDPEPTLYNDARYSMRMANQNVWESNTGYNKLLMNVQVGNFNTTTYNGSQVLANANSVGANCGIFYNDGSISGSGNSNGTTPPNSGGNCPTNLTLNASDNVTSGNNGDESVSNNIEATNTIFANASATYTAGNRINLKPGFKALFGSYFNAFIEACTSPKLANPENNQVVKNINTLDLEEQVLKGALDEKLLIFPNPLEDKASIIYNLSSADKVTLSLFNATGKHLTTLTENQAQPAGQHQIDLDGSNLATGMYYLKLQSNDNNVIKKLMIAK